MIDAIFTDTAETFKTKVATSTVLNYLNGTIVIDNKICGVVEGISNEESHKLFPQRVSLITHILISNLSLNCV